MCVSPYASIVNKKMHIKIGVAPSTIKNIFIFVRSVGCCFKRIIATGTATNSTILESRATTSNVPTPLLTRLELEFEFVIVRIYSAPTHTTGIDSEK